METLFGIGSGNGVSGGSSVNELVPMGGSRSGAEIDAANAGTSGFFHPIGDDFWSSETDLTACSSSSFNRNNRYAVCFFLRNSFISIHVSAWKREKCSMGLLLTFPHFF